MDQETILEIQKFVKSAESENAGSLKEKILDFLDKKKKTLSTDEIRRKLIACQKKFSETEEFQEGDLIKWKEDLKNRRYPKYDEPAIVVEVLDEPIYNNDEPTPSPYFKEELTMRIGFIVEDNNDFLVYLVDKRRFEKYENNN